MGKVEITPEVLRELASDNNLLEVGRLAIENTLIDFRDSRISQLRNNGFVIKERDGSDSHIIRFGPEHGLSIALRAIADSLEEKQGFEGVCTKGETEK